MIGCGFKYGTKIDAIDAKVRQVIQMIHHTLQISPKSLLGLDLYFPKVKCVRGHLLCPRLQIFREKFDTILFLLPILE